MSRILRQQTFWRNALIVLMVTGGSGVGFLLGRTAVIWQSLNKLDHYASVVVDQNDASLGEAREALDSIKHSGNSTCADEEIGGLRDLVFRSSHLKDAGRIGGDMIECSATTGRSVRSLSALVADASPTNGGLTYYSLKNVAKTEPDRAALRLDNAFVVTDSGVALNQGGDPVRLAVTTVGSINSQAGAIADQLPGIQEPRMTQEGSGHLGNVLYATRCSSLGFNCITLSLPADYVLQHGNLALAALAAVGAMTGLLLGMLLLNARLRHQDLPSQLRRALDRDELEVVYQPIVNLSTQMIVGAEALARWKNSEGVPVEPDIFVKIAEENGIAGKITKSVLRHILQNFAKTLQNRPSFRISMNVAAADLSDPNFLPMLDQSLNQANVKSESLVIEITERSAADSEVAMETIRELRRRGFGIHIDDFGTGHSNLDKLLYLFADTIKIDRAFTEVIGTESESVTAAILPQILNMAKSLGLGVVVEGVETQAQSDYFCPSEQKIYAQGWLYGHPVSAEGLLSQMATNDAPASVREEYETGPVVDLTEFTARPGTLQLVKSHVA
jgi:sensor c-di-GMP phosphodiesterase-like protein